jgi:hypothetical protein
VSVSTCSCYLGGDTADAKSYACNASFSQLSEQNVDCVDLKSSDLVDSQLCQLMCSMNPNQNAPIKGNTRRGE